MTRAGPADRAVLRAWLERRRLDFGPGATFVAGAPPRFDAAVHACDPNPGDGYHREHVRRLEVAVAGEALTPAAARAVSGLVAEALAALRERTRAEASAPAGEELLLRALVAGGLAEEARLPGGWRRAGRTEALVLLGRPARRALGAAPGEGAREAPADPVQPASWRAHDAATRDALRRFLDALVPGRSYPAGTLLSEAERVETRRPGDLELPWELALDERGEILGGAVLERPAAAGRRHVARVHVDVVPQARGRGVATGLLRRARARAGRLGLAVVEADPRGGNAGALAALRAAGFVEAGRQRGGWRMRAAAEAWDEDVVLLSAAAGPDGPEGPGGPAGLTPPRPPRPPGRGA